MLFSAPATAQVFSDGYQFLKAVREKDGEAVTAALSDPASTIVNARDITTGESAMHIVTQRRDLTWMRFLVSEGANVNLRDKRGVSPLELAVGLGFVEGVEYLAQHGARLNDTNATGETPLILATHQRNADLARVLIAAGADPDRTDSAGRSARDYAELDGRANPVLAVIENSDTAEADAVLYGPVIR